MDTIRGGSFFVNCVNQTVLFEISALKKCSNGYFMPQKSPCLHFRLYRNGYRLIPSNKTVIGKTVGHHRRATQTDVETNQY